MWIVFAPGHDRLRTYINTSGRFTRDNGTADDSWQFDLFNPPKFFFGHSDRREGSSLLCYGRFCSLNRRLDICNFYNRLILFRVSLT